MHDIVKTPEDGAVALFVAVVLQAQRDAAHKDQEALNFVWDVTPELATRFHLPQIVQLSLLEVV